MSPTQPANFIQAYIDKFLFVEAKKYLALVGPLGMNVIHDNMYPLLTINTSLIISRPPEGKPRSKKLSCFWYQDIVHPCLITHVYEDGSFKVCYLNKDDPPRVFPNESYLGEITSPKVSLYWKWKFWRLSQ
ncbi:MAG: hypothetical protein NXH75_00055 [Halobacteriovoraceae bacterium]|nr:hypothetical protein [Halobacteriovoraceae bacterium]